LQGENKGRVIAYANYVELKNCKLKVSQAGRKRVLKEKRKNVHAGIVGELSHHTILTENWTDMHDKIPGQSVTYSPYRFESFVNAKTHEPMHTAKRITMLAVGRPCVKAS